MKEDNNQMDFQTLMDNLAPLLDEWSITEYKMHQMSLKHIEIPQELANLKNDIIDKVEDLIMQHNLPAPKKLNQ